MVINTQSSFQNVSTEKQSLTGRRIFLPLEIKLTTAPVEIELEVERVRHLRYINAIERGFVKVKKTG